MTARFLFDERADSRLIPHLVGLGHNATAISRDYPAGIPDKEVLAIAVREQRTLDTVDLDCGELVFREGLHHAGIILIRLPGAALPTKMARLNEVLAQFGGNLDQFFEITESGVRVRQAADSTGPE